MNYQINDKFDFTTVWTYHSGSRISLPLMTYVHVDLPETDRHIDLMELDHRNNYKMNDIIDIDAGTIISGEESVEQVGERILESIIDIASGKIKAKADSSGHDDFIPWKRGISL